MKPTREELSAWLDGSLPPDDAERISAAIREDEELADRLGRMKRNDALVRAAVPLDAGLPPELARRLGLGDDKAAGNVVELASARSARNAATPAKAEPATRHAPGWRIAAQVALVACLGIAAATWLGTRPGEAPEAAYRALSDASSPAGQAARPVSAIVMFDGNVDAGKASGIIRSAGASLVGSPTKSGVWQLAIDPGKRESVLEALRGNPDVRLAEPVDGMSR